VSAARVEESENESDGEVAAVVDLENKRTEQAVLMEHHRSNFKGINDCDWKNSRASAPELKIIKNASNV
jgi:hypothetical protein